MWNIEAIDIGLIIIAFAQAILAALLLLLGGRYRTVVLPLAAFFIANALTELPELVDFLSTSQMPATVGHILEMVLILANLTLAPLIWLYVRGLTSEGYPQFTRHDLIHFVGLLIGLIAVLLVILLPFDQRDLLLGEGTQPRSQFGFTVMFYFVFMILVFYGQCAGYIIAVVLRLTSYRTRLRDVFASTEDREMRWISALAVLLGCYWLYSMSVTILEIFFDYDFGLDLPETVLNVILVLSLAIWGLRQKPGFEVTTMAPELAEPVTPAIKYERSALSDAQSQKIAAKIHRAMEDDLLYRDPNLSLWLLAKHISVTSNYVSQTLNTTIGDTFFDYVNRWRINEAKPLIKDGSDTVLAIAYEVGFNSRSSFYTAFKRETGMTPTQFKDAAVSSA